MAGSAQGFDEFLYENDDSLIVSAAGNYGAGNAEFSLVDPATAKNTLTVGMTNNGRPSTKYEEDGTNGGNRVAFGADATLELKRSFVQFKMDEWEAFRWGAGNEEMSTGRIAARCVPASRADCFSRV